MKFSDTHAMKSKAKCKKNTFFVGCFNVFKTHTFNYSENERIEVIEKKILDFC